MSTPDAGQTMTIDQAITTAYAHWNAGQPGPAEQLARQVLQAWPEHPGALHLMGLLAFTAGNRPLAIAYIQRACASPSAPALFYSNLAEMLRQDGKLVEAEGAARQALQLDSQSQAAWTNLGIILQEAGKLEESLDCLMRAVAINPEVAENHNNLANTLRRMNRLDDARAEYTAAIKLKPSYAEAHNNLGHLLTSLGQHEAALSEIREAIGLNPQYADAYVNAAAVALAMGAPEEALRWLGNLASFAPNHAGGLITQARALIELDCEAEALEAARRAMAAAPASGDAANVLAHALNLNGQADEALAMYEKAVALPCPQPEAAIIDKAMLLGELDRLDEAAATLDKALAVNPQSARGLYNRACLESSAIDESAIARMEDQLGRKLVAPNDSIMARSRRCRSRVRPLCRRQPSEACHIPIRWGRDRELDGCHSGDLLRRFIEALRRRRRCQSGSGIRGGNAALRHNAGRAGACLSS
jgi:tetratricopeptide (TPR) repeat protein